LLVWRNTMKSFSERRQDASPAQRLGLLTRKLAVEDVLVRRLFPTRVALPARWAAYYWREIPTRRIANGARHRARFAAWIRAARVERRARSGRRGPIWSAQLKA